MMLCLVPGPSNPDQNAPRHDAGLNFGGRGSPDFPTCCDLGRLLDSAIRDNFTCDLRMQREQSIRE